jgi:hypothetical protein
MGYNAFWKSIAQKFIQIKIEPALLAYLIIVLIVGNIGSLFTWYAVAHSPEQDAYRLAQSAATGFVAVAICGWLDIVLEKDMSMHRSYIGWVGVLTLVTIGLLVLCFLITTSVSLLYAGIGEFVAITIWIIANANSAKLKDDFNAAFAPETSGHGKGW